MNFHTTDTPYGSCVIGSNDTLSTARLVKGYTDASRVMLCRKPMLLVYSADINKSHCLYDDLYLIKFSPSNALLESLLFNDVFCKELLNKDLGQLTSSQFDEFLLSLHNPSKLSGWSQKGLLCIALPLQPEYPPILFRDNLGLPGSSPCSSEKSWHNTCCLDFDGVISKFGVEDAGEPVEGALSGIELLISSGWFIEIYSGRSRDPSGIESLRSWVATNFPSLSDAIESGSIIFAEQKPNAKVYIDDRAIKFEGWDKITPDVLESYRACWQHPDSTE